MARKRGAVRKRALLWGTAGVLLWWALRSVSLADLWAAVRQVNPMLLAFLVAMNLIILWCFGGRGWLILRAMGYRIPYHRQVAYRVAAFSVNYFTPGPQFGGEPLHVYLLHHQHAVPWETATAVVAVDKLLEMTVNLAFLIVGVGVLIAFDVLPPPARLPLLAGSALLTSLPPIYFVALTREYLPLSRLAMRFGQHKALRYIARAEAQAGRLYRTHTRVMILAVGLSIATWGLLVAEYGLMTNALGMSLALPHLIAVMTAARLSFLFPIPAGLGTLEASQALAMDALGFDPTTGIAITLLIRARDILVSTAGLAITHRYA